MLNILLIKYNMRYLVYYMNKMEKKNR